MIRAVTLYHYRYQEVQADKLLTDSVFIYDFFYMTGLLKYSVLFFAKIHKKLKSTSQFSVGQCGNTVKDKWHILFQICALIISDCNEKNC